MQSRKQADYQGWTNYETWAVALWIDNDQGSQEYWREMAKELREQSEYEDHPHWTPEQWVKFTLADMLKETHEENNPVTDASVYSDLMSAALSEVNWNEIAGSMMEE